MSERRKSRGTGWVVGAGAAAAASLAPAQSLFQRESLPAASQPQPSSGDPVPKVNPVAQLEGISLYAIQPASSRKFRPHDLITVIVNQSSKMEHDQKDDLKKDYTNNAALAAFPDLAKFLQFRLESGRVGGQDGGLPSLDLSSNNKYKGDAKIDREDRITARITAEVIEVKPNGNLVLEARATQITDKEEQTMILSGVCRGEDITVQNTLQSTQLAELHLETQHKGDVKDTATKGLIPRVLETIFNF